MPDQSIDQNGNTRRAAEREPWTKVTARVGPKAEARGLDMGQYTPMGSLISGAINPEQVMLMKTDPFWCLVLERIHPTSLAREFTAVEFELAFAVNIRTALRLVEATAACRRFADVAISNAVNYSCLRHGGKSGRILEDAHRAIDEALWRFITELGNCKVKARSTPERISIYPTRMTRHRNAKLATLRPGNHIAVRPDEQF